MHAVKTARDALHAQDDYRLAEALVALRQAANGDFKARLEEIPLGYRLAMNLIGMLDDQKRLKYTKTELLQLIATLGTTKTVETLRRLKSKTPPGQLIEQYESATVAEIKRRLPSRNPRKKKQATILFTANLTPADHRRLLKHLRQYGLKPGTGKKVGVGQAFAEMVRDL